MATGNETIAWGIGALSRYLDVAVLTQAATGVGIFIASYLICRLAIFIFTRIARRIGAQMRTSIEDAAGALVNAIQWPLKFFALSISTYIAFALTVPNMEVFGWTTGDLLFIAVVFFAFFLLAKTVSAVIKWYGKEIAVTERGREVFPIVRKIIGILFYAIALGIVLDHFGVQIAPLVAGLGIAGLAVALALQETLANFFAGVYILADKPVRLGDYVKLEDGTEGYVEEIGWRSTKIRLLTENSLIIPNSMLSQQKIVNHNMPGAGLLVPVLVSAAYDSDPDKVERVLLETAGETVMKTPGTVKTFKPVVRLINLGDFALEYKIWFQVETFTDQWAAASTMRKSILKAFKKEKIEIPFPTRTLYTRKA